MSSDVHDDVRVAVITGATQGLGLETAKRLAEHGLRVIITGRELAVARSVAADLRAHGHRADAAVLDVASDESVAAFAAWLEREHGRVDVLVNNAGAIFEEGAGWNDETVFTIPARTLLASLDNNTLGAYRVTQALMPRMNAAGYGRIVNVSSGMGALADMDGAFPAYRMSKTGLNVLTRVFHAAAAPGVKINSVCPGWVRTQMGGAHATRSVEDGAVGIVWAATLPDDGPSGGFFRDAKPIAW